MKNYISGNIRKIIYESNNGPYKIGLFRSHTKDVDIDNESKCRKFFYKILSKIYNLIY